MEGSNGGGAASEATTKQGTSTESQPAASQAPAGDGGSSNQGSKGDQTSADQGQPQIPLATFKKSEARVKDLEKELKKLQDAALSEEERKENRIKELEAAVVDNHRKAQASVAQAQAALLGASNPDHVSRLITIPDDADDDAIKELVSQAKEDESFSYLFTGSKPTGGAPVDLGGSEPRKGSGGQDPSESFRDSLRDALKHRPGALT